MRKPLIDATNTVVNIIEIEPDANYKEPDGLHMLDEHPDAIIGGSYDPETDTFAPPPDPEPAPDPAPEGDL